MKWTALLLFLVCSQSEACFITVHNEAAQNNPILVATHMISTVVLRSRQEVYLTLVSGEEYRITERVPDVEAKIKACK